MDIFSALADPTRRKIMELLASRGQLNASEISAEFDMTPPAISQHLKILREANLVQMEKHAQQHLYRINPPAMLELEGWAKQLATLWSQRLDALDEVLQAEKKKNLIDNQKGK